MEGKEALNSDLRKVGRERGGKIKRIWQGRPKKKKGRDIREYPALKMPLVHLSSTTTKED